MEKNHPTIHPTICIQPQSWNERLGDALCCNNIASMLSVEHRNIALKNYIRSSGFYYNFLAKTIIAFLKMLFITLLLFNVDCRRKKQKEATSPDDEPIKYQPEFGKVWYPEPKKWGHYVGRERHALVAFVQQDDPGRQMASVMEQVIDMIDKSKLNIVVAETFKIGQIIEDQGVTEFPSVRFYKAGMKKWSQIYEGYPSAKAVARWANQIVRELDEWENMDDFD